METIWDGLAKSGMNEAQLEKLFGLNIHHLYKDVIRSLPSVDFGEAGAADAARLRLIPLRLSFRIQR